MLKPHTMNVRRAERALVGTEEGPEGNVTRLVSRARPAHARPLAEIGKVIDAMRSHEIVKPRPDSPDSCIDKRP
jgi:hypothetical protein